MIQTQLKGHQWVKEGLVISHTYDYGWCQVIVDGTHLHGSQYIGMSGLRNGSNQFCSAGDSGSAIFDIDGNFNGLLVGGDSRKNCSIFIPVEELFADIRTFTGATEVRMLS